MQHLDDGGATAALQFAPTPKTSKESQTRKRRGLVTETYKDGDFEKQKSSEDMMVSCEENGSFCIREAIWKRNGGFFGEGERERCSTVELYSNEKA